MFEVVPSFRLYRPLEDGGPLPPQDSEYCALVPGFWIIEGHNLPWSKLAHHTDQIFAAGDGAVVVYQPWWPGANARRQHFEAAFRPFVRTSAGVQIAEIDGRVDLATYVLTLREQNGGAKSGLWLIASPISKEALISSLHIEKQSGPPSTLATEVASDLLAALCFDESELSTLMIRRSHPRFEVLSTLMEGLTVADQ